MEIKEILIDRAATHGDFVNVSNVHQRILVALDHGPGRMAMTPAQRTALEMIAMKMARIVCGDPYFADHWDDIAGYSELGRGGDK